MRRREPTNRRRPSAHHLATQAEELQGLAQRPARQSVAPRANMSPDMSMQGLAAQTLIWLVGCSKNAVDVVRRIEATLDIRRVDLASIGDAERNRGSDDAESFSERLFAFIENQSGDANILLDATALGDAGQRRLVLATTLRRVRSAAVVVLCSSPDTTTWNRAGAAVATYALAESIPTCFVPHDAPETAAAWMREKFAAEPANADRAGGSPVS